MIKLKRYMALAVSLAVVSAMSACGNSDEKNASSGTESAVEKVQVDDTDAIDAIPDDAQKEILWMGTYDLNPAEGADETVEMTLFHNKGGSVKWIQVSDAEKFDKLASSIVARQNVPDIFKYEWMAFPSQVLKDMYQPIDTIVDFDDPLWADTKKTADQFVLGGEHYVAPISYGVSVMMMYDHAVIEANGLDDPYEEYLEGNWNWDTWIGIMEDFCENSNDDEQRYGINGWFMTQVIQQSGKTMINYEDGKFISNLNDPDIERAENMLYDISKKGYINTSWLGSAKSAIKGGDNLFFSMGLWAMTGKNGPSEGDDWRIVPMPTDPNSDEKVVSAEINAYMWVKGSTADEAVKTWFECCRIANTDEQYKADGRQKFMNANPAWTDEMYDCFSNAVDSDTKVLFDYGYGISSVMSDDQASADGSCITRKLYEYISQEDGDGVQYTWTSLRNTYSATIESELKEINEAVAEYQSGN